VDCIAWTVEGREERVGRTWSDITFEHAELVHCPALLPLVIRAATDSADVLVEASIMDQVPGSGLIGESRAFRTVLRAIERVAPTDCPVLITGETGTGKELAAWAIHSQSKRAAGPLVFLNCSAIPPSLAESELFGFERGAFTGASTSYAGKFGEAHNGTLVLDEIGELELRLQAKLLRVVESGHLGRLRSRGALKVDARVIATTNRDLRSMAESGLFRSDLYYRLSVVSIGLPPLRERGDDVISLASFFLDQYAEAHHRRIKGFLPCAVELLRTHPWPGNVRELKHCIERAVLFSKDGHIGGSDLDLSYPRLRRLRREHTEAELASVRAAPRRNRGNVSKTARDIGFSRKGLMGILEKYNIDAAAYRREKIG
jgi:two-component system NtrC family response regulator